MKRACTELARDWQVNGFLGSDAMANAIEELIKNRSAAELAKQQVTQPLWIHRLG